ncbi:MAG: tetratricopeptide repeat protein [Verrucomicrobiia bacterium]
MKTQKLVPLLLVIAGLLAYHNSLRGAFIFDDPTSISENPYIRHLWPIRDAMSAPQGTTVSGRPVVCLTLALNYAVGGWNVWGYHALNLTVHLLSALVLFGILRRTFEGATLRDRFGGAAVWLAAAITLIWEVHPLQTESVTYIVQRTELLMGLFLLLTLYCTLRCSQSPHASVWCLAAIVSCALGMGSKEVMVAAPLIVLLYDRVFLASSFHELWRRRAVLYVGLAATWLILAVLVATTPRANTGFGIEGLTPWNYLKTEAGVIVYYLRLCFWPHPLVIDYFDWPIARSLEDCLVPGVVVVGLLSATAWAFRRRPQLGFLGAWFFLVLGPTSSFLPSFGEVAAERRMYLPLAAVVTMVGGGAFLLGKRLLNRRQDLVLGCIASGAAVVLLTFLTVQRNWDYTSDLTIWQDTVEKRPNNPRAHCALGMALAQAGRIPEAIEHLQQALRIRPNYAEAHNDLGTALAQTGKTEEAIAHYQQALRIRPNYAEAHYNLGMALAQTGKIGEAIAHFEQALRIKPDFAGAHNNLGMALAQTGKIEEAIAHFEQALQIDPDFAEAHSNLGIALVRVGRVPEAIGQYGQALRIKPDSAEAHSNLGNALVRVGRLPEAIVQYEQALRIKPDSAEVHYNLGIALVRLGKVTEAIAQYQQALEINPTNASAHSKLGAALIATGNAHDALSQLAQALRIKPDLAEAQNKLAWVLATLPPTEGGDPVRAVALAQRACELSGNRAPGDLDTLAVAYAAAGRFDAAVATAQKAIDLACSAGQTELVEEIQARLQLYRSGRAYSPSAGATSPSNP